MIGLLLSLAAFASAALAQNIAISQPPVGSNVTAGAAFTITVERPTPSIDYEDIAIVIAASACMDGCSDDGLGYNLLYNGLFNPQTSGSSELQSFTVTAPNSFDGTAQISVAHFYLEGLTNVVMQETAKSTVTIIGASG